MPTLGGTITAIRNDLNRGTDFDVRIQEALVNAITFYRARRYGFNTKRKGFSVSTEYTSLTANFIEIDYLKLTVSNYLKPLCEESYLLLNERMTDPSLSDEPVYFAVQDRNIRLYPPPDRSYSVEMHYLYDITGVSLSTSDSITINAWLTEGYELIKTHAEIELLEMYIEGPEAMQKADRLRARETQVENELKRRANREQGAGKVRGVM